MKKKQITFDFGDGRGEVPAHQHINPDKSIGGWVEDNCEVSENSYIFAGSRVDNNSIVYNSRVYNSRVDNSRVYNSSVDNSSVDNSSVDNSSVYNNSRVYNSRVDNSRVDNNSSVDNASIHHCQISNSKQIYTQCPIGSRNDRVTAWYSPEDKLIHVRAGCFGENNLETLETLQVAVFETHGHNNFGKEYLAFIQNAKNHFEIRKDELDNIEYKEN